VQGWWVIRERFPNLEANLMTLYANVNDLYKCEYRYQLNTVKRTAEQIVKDLDTETENWVEKLEDFWAEEHVSSHTKSESPGEAMSKVASPGEAMSKVASPGEAMSKVASPGEAMSKVASPLSFPSPQQIESSPILLPSSSSSPLSFPRQINTSLSMPSVAGNFQSSNEDQQRSPNQRSLSKTPPGMFFCQEKTCENPSPPLLSRKQAFKTPPPSTGKRNAHVSPKSPAQKTSFAPLPQKPNSPDGSRTSSKTPPNVSSKNDEKRSPPKPSLHVKTRRKSLTNTFFSGKK